MSDAVTEWKYPYFTEFEIRVLYPDIIYVEPGDEVAEGVVVRDFDELGPNPKIFRVEDGEIIQLIPVRITNEDGVHTDVWSASISFTDSDDEDSLDEDEQE